MRGAPTNEVCYGATLFYQISEGSGISRGSSINALAGVYYKYVVSSLPYGDIGYINEYSTYGSHIDGVKY